MKYDLRSLTGTDYLLVGFCYGRYAQLRTLGLSENFIDILKNDLSLFSPESCAMGAVEHFRPAPEQADHARKNDGSREVLCVSRDGYRSVALLLRSYPNVVLRLDLETNEVMAKRVFPERELVLVDVLILALRDSLWLAPEEHLAYVLVDFYRSYPGRSWEDAEEFLAQERSISNGSPSDHSERLRDQLMMSPSGEDERSFFRIGQLFGEVVAELEWAFSWEQAEFGEAPVAIDLTSRSQRLMEHPFIADNATVRNLLEDPRYQKVNLEQICPPDMGEQGDAMKRRWWLAFGYLVRIAQDIDWGEFLQSSKNGGADHILGRPRSDLSNVDEPEGTSIDSKISRAERQLEMSRGGKDSVSAMDLVAMLAPSGEELVKETWPEMFRVDYGGRLATVLHEKIRSRSPLESRFASIALTLHKQYRIPATHQSKEFACGPEEAAYVIASLKALQKISDAIAREGNSSQER